MRFPLKANLFRLALGGLEHAFALYAGISGARARFIVGPDGDRVEGRGRLALRRGWRFLHLEGTPRDMGLQQGRLLAPEIHRLLGTYLGGVRLFRGLARRTLLERGRRLEPFIPERYREEMEALAEGAGLAYEDVLLGHTFLEGIQAIACSCYAAWGRATRDGELVFGRNLEFFSMGVAHLAQVIVFRRPDRGMATLSVSWPGWCGTLTAVNAAGLCIGPLNVNRFQRELVGQPYIVMFRRLAEEAEDCAGAVELLRATRRTYSNNVLIAQTRPTPHAVVAEYTKRIVVVREPRPGNDFILSTNHFRKLGRTGELPEGSGYARYPALYRSLERNAGRIDLDTDLFGDPQVHLPCSLHCVVAAPARREARIAIGLPAATAPYRRIIYDDNGIRLDAAI